MIIKTMRRRRTALIVMLLLVAGCGTSLTKPVLETDGKEMIDIYRNALEDGKTVDDKLDAEKHGIEANASDIDKTKIADGTASEHYVDPAILAANKPRGRRYANKAYTKYKGRYYDKKTGLQVTTFRCGVNTKIRTKPCGKSFGFGSAVREEASKPKKVVARVDEVETSNRVVTPEDIIARDQADNRERAESQRRQEQALSAALGKVSPSAKVDVKHAQQLLNKGGFDVGTPDGFVGTKTSKGLSSFQSRNGLVATGALNMATIAALDALYGDPKQSLTVGAVPQVSRESARKPTEPCNADDLYCGYSRTSDNEIQQLFPRLENPDIVVYVTPHLATHNKVPVPGYTTAFPLYDEVHYAMPGEQVTQ